MDLTAKQRAHLRSLAHRLKPVIHVGNGGVTAGVLSSVGDALNTRELIKVKALETAPSGIRDIAGAIAEGAEGVTVVQTIGRTAVLYRPFPEKPEIRLPKTGA